MNLIDRDITGILCMTIVVIAGLLVIMRVESERADTKKECLKNNPGHGEVCNENLY